MEASEFVAAVRDDQVETNADRTHYLHLFVFLNISHSWAQIYTAVNVHVPFNKSQSL